MAVKTNLETQKIVCQNKKAKHEYTLEDTIEAGMVLLGPEVKSLRDGRANLTDSYARVVNGEVYLYNFHISPYPFAPVKELDPLRPKKLLLHKREIKRLIGKTEQKGYTLIPIKVYFKRGKAKVEIALAKGKTKYDRRRELREKEAKREMEQSRKGGRFI